MRNSSSVRTRFAPSPTGDLHIGGARTALFCWLYARRFGGSFVLRIEDTDRARSTEASVSTILEGLSWLGLDWDEGPIFQSDRFERYREQIQTLLARGEAYYCYCTRERLETLREAQRARGEKPRYDGRCRERTGEPPAGGPPPVVRFRNPLAGEVVVEDAIKGRIAFANAELDDLIIARSDGTPTYNFTVVVDDMELDISHVIRGDDHVNNTPRQINLLRALGGRVPVYAHVPMILSANGKRMSKREGAQGVEAFRDAGYLPDALVNYLARLGWSHGDQEVFSRDELIRLFDIAEVNRAAAVFDHDKLTWLNQHYIQGAGAESLREPLRRELERIGLDPAQGPDIGLVVEVQRDRARTLVDMAEKSVFAYRDFDAYDEGAAKKHLRPVALEPLLAVRERLAALDAWEAEPLHAAVAGTAEVLDLKLGRLAQPLRVALTGTATSPSIEKTLLLVGRERSLARIDVACAHVRARAALS